MHHLECIVSPVRCASFEVACIIWNLEHVITGDYNRVMTHKFRWHSNGVHVLDRAEHLFDTLCRLDQT